MGKFTLLILVVCTFLVICAFDDAQGKQQRGKSIKPKTYFRPVKRPKTPQASRIPKPVEGLSPKKSFGSRLTSLFSLSQPTTTGKQGKVGKTGKDKTGKGTGQQTPLLATYLSTLLQSRTPAPHHSYPYSGGNLRNTQGHHGGGGSWGHQPQTSYGQQYYPQPGSAYGKPGGIIGGGNTHHAEEDQE